MNGGQGDDLAGDLVRFHRAISRGFLIAADASHSFSRGGFDDAEIKLGFLNYVRAHVATLVAHHQAEDTIVFPRFRQRITDAPYEELLDEHRQMEPFFDQMRLAVTDLRTGLHVKESLEVLVYALNKNREVWRPHIYKEEQYFNAEAVNAAIPAADQHELRRVMAQYSLQNAQPESLTLPYLLYNLSGADRAAITANLPPALVDRMQGEWKSLWRSMAPFLLA